jgi:ubiquinone/menaquinone biosynthesis C-methylase UbiE
MEITDFYNIAAKSYDSLHKEEQLNKLNIISKYIRPKKDETLLDVGCGTGISTKFWNCKAIGIDPSKELVKICGSKCKVGKAENLPFKDKSFDYVISVTAIQNFDNIEKGLKEMKRVAKGHIIITALKKSQKIKTIRKLINRHFKAHKELQEEKDLIFIIR